MRITRSTRATTGLLGACPTCPGIRSFIRTATGSLARATQETPAPATATDRPGGLAYLCRQPFCSPLEGYVAHKAWDVMERALCQMSRRTAPRAYFVLCGLVLFAAPLPGQRPPADYEFGARLVAA